MKKTSCRRPLWRGAPGGANPTAGLSARHFPLCLLLVAASTPALAVAAPQLTLHSQVPALWALLPTLAAAGLTLLAAVLALRLRSSIHAGDARIADLQSHNAGLYRQLQARGRDMAAWERELAEARALIDELRQDKSDFVAVLGHRLRQPLDALVSTLNRLVELGGDARPLAELARTQGQALLRVAADARRPARFEKVELTLPPQLEQPAGHSRPQAGPASRGSLRPVRLLNTSTLNRQRDTLGHLVFAEMLSERMARLPKRITEFTSALTGRHWLDAERLAQSIAASAEEVGLEAVAARLRALAARLGVDAEREYCRRQRTDILNLTRHSLQQLKSWRGQNVHTEWAVK